MKKIFLVVMIITFILGGCSNKEDLGTFDLDGYWVDEHIYNNGLGVDKVIQFVDDKKMIVYSYYDKGTTIYELKIKESSSNRIIFSINDGNEVIELEKMSDEKYKYTINDEDLYIIKINKSEAEKFIQVIEENSEY